MTSNPQLTEQALNRATLARQMLLARQELPAATALTRLAGMQAQAPDAPYVGLWSRLAGFRTAELAGLVSTRQAVRIPLMRTTIHLVTADDALMLHPLTRPVHARAFASNAFARNIAGVDWDALRAAGRSLLAEKPRTRAELAPLLAARWPGFDPTSLAYGVTYLEPVVQVPPRGLWGQAGPAAWAPAEAWIGRPFDPAPSPERLVLRYLAAFGPATVADIQAWSGLTRLGEITERLRPGLCVFTGPGGAELLDLPDAPRPDPDTPAPPRFLPEYDNLLLSHADRGRVNPGGHPVPLYPGNGGRCGMLLLDGRFRGTWRITAGGRRNAAKDTATLLIQPFAALPGADEAALTEEGTALLGFAAAQAARHEVHVQPPAG